MKVDDPLVACEAVVGRLMRNAGATIDPADYKIIDILIEELNDKSKAEADPLYLVNCLQLLADLAVSPPALSYLEQHNVPSKLLSMLQACDPIIVPHALKFFYRVNPSEFRTKYSQVLDMVCEYCQSGIYQLLDYAVDFIGTIGRAGLGARRVLDEHPEFKQKCLSRLGYVLINSDGVIKSRTLRCIVDLLEMQEDYGDEQKRDEASQLASRFYHALIEGERRTTNKLMALCRVPFMNIRINALLVVAAVAGEAWAQQEFAAQPDFLAWILNRSSETCKEAKEAKFAILNAIITSKSATRTFKGEDYLKMRVDWKKGPYHKGIAEEMLMDNQQAT